jgi:hypothetical protein
MVQAGGELDLAAKPVRAHRAGRFGRQDLDDDVAGERRFPRDENARHSPASELALEHVRTAECRLQLFAKIGRRGHAAFPWTVSLR